MRFLLACLLTIVSLGRAPAVHAQADPPDADEARRLRRTPVVEVFEQTRDGVVNISSTQVIQIRSFNPLDQLFDDLFDVRPELRRPRDRQITRTSVGSGFVIHPDGYIVTNAHVVMRTAERKAIFADGREFDARIVAADPLRDLAVLKIDADRPLPAIPLGTSSDLMVGETVVAIGNPLGYQHTVTSGVVSAVDRELPISDEVTFTGLIQTDASINPGNSGGPLLNILGQLIGVNTAIRADAQNIGFAIPVDQLRALLPGMLSVERRYGISLGATVRDGPSGAMIDRVEPNSPAAKAGLAAGDTIVAVDGQPLRSAIDFHIAMIGRKPGDVLAMRVGRLGVVDVRLAERSKPDATALLSQRLGIRVEPLTPQMARAIGAPGARGLMIAQLERGGPAHTAGLQRGDVLLLIGQHEASDLDEVGELLDAVSPGAALSVDALRVSGRTLYRLRLRLVAR